MPVFDAGPGSNPGSLRCARFQFARPFGTLPHCAQAQQCRFCYLGTRPGSQRGTSGSLIELVTFHVGLWPPDRHAAERPGAAAQPFGTHATQWAAQILEQTCTFPIIAHIRRAVAGVGTLLTRVPPCEALPHPNTVACIPPCLEHALEVNVYSGK